MYISASQSKEVIDQTLESADFCVHYVEVVGYRIGNGCVAVICPRRIRVALNGGAWSAHFVRHSCHKRAPPNEQSCVFLTLLPQRLQRFPHLRGRLIVLHVEQGYFMPAVIPCGRIKVPVAVDSRPHAVSMAFPQPRSLFVTRRTALSTLRSPGT